MPKGRRRWKGHERATDELLAKQQLLDDVRYILAREELVKELGRQFGTKPEGLWRHPATLLVLGWMLTGVLGAGLTSCWQHRQWEIEQKSSSREQKRVAMIKVLEDVSLATAETFTAAEDVLYVFEWDWKDEDSLTNAANRIQAWEQHSRLWRSKSKMLTAVLQARFTESESLTLFHEIIRKRRFLGNSITNLLHRLEHEEDKAQLADDQEVEAMRSEARALINETTGPAGLLTRLVAQLVAEIDRLSDEET